MAIVEVIKWEVNTRELVYKFHSNDIRIGSQLVVYPSQIAFFVKGGKIFDTFTEGTYTIETNNIPLLNKVLNIPFGSESPFQAEVWFVNLISILDFKWGTPTPIQIEDPKYKVIIPLKAFGQYGFHIRAPRLFLEKFIGNMPSFSTEAFVTYLRGLILSKMTSIITQKLYEDQLSLINIGSYLDSISTYAQTCLRPVFDAYGIDLEMFVVMSISVDESDESFIRLKETIDSLARINIMGTDNYKMDRSFDVLQQAAESDGAGLIGAAVGLGAGVGIGSQINNLVGQQLHTGGSTPPPMPGTSDYFLGINGRQEGPLNFNAVIEAIRSGRAATDTLIWRKGLDRWLQISDLPEFSNLVNFPPPFPN